MYVVDTNLYVHAARDPAFRADLRAFLARAAVRVRVSAVVVHELLVGAADQHARDAVVRDVLGPFARRSRIVDADLDVWREAAAIVQAIAARGGYADKLRAANFRHDVLIAASCRRVGATLVTANQSDFELIASVHGFRFETAFPE